jgi:cytochrome c oxidase assembly factor 1
MDQYSLFNSLSFFHLMHYNMRCQKDPKKFKSRCLGTSSLSCYLFIYFYLSGNMVSNRTLAQIAAYGGVFVASTGMLVHWKLQERVKGSEFHKEGMKILRKHQPSLSLLGEPIKAGNIDLGDNAANCCNSAHAQLQIPVKGPKNKGTLFLWAEKVDPQEKWNVYRLELGLKNDLSRRLLIKNDSPSNNNNNNNNNNT